MNFTTENISFLKNVDSNVNIDKSSGWRHHFFDGSLIQIETFIKKIGDDKIYLLIPLFASSQSFSEPTLNLSEPFLVTNRSNPQLIINHIMNQWNSSPFELKDGRELIFSFKFKRVWWSYK